MAQKRRGAGLSDPQLRKFTLAVLKEYRRSGSAASNENLKHVRRMARLVWGQESALAEIGCDAQILQVAILVSDLGKEEHFLRKHLARYRHQRFRAFMDHSRISMIEGNRLRKEAGISNELWRRILGGVLGHDGPSISGSWWKQHYENQLMRPYPRLRTIEGLVHCYLDRMDQGGIYLDRSGRLNGGLRKISFDLYEREVTRDPGLALYRVLQNVFGPTRDGTREQLRHLDQVERPRILGSHPLPRFLGDHRADFELAERYFTHVLYRENQGVSVLQDDGAALRVEDLDEFWRTLSQVTPEDPEASPQLASNS